MLNANPPTGRRVALVTILTLLGLCVAVVCGLAIGPTPIGTIRIVGSIFSHVGIGHSTLSTLQSTVIWQLRAPRLVLGLLAGAMLSVAGGTYQGVFRNPLADPYLLGVAAGAGLGATFAIMDIGGGAYTPTWTEPRSAPVLPSPERWSPSRSRGSSAAAGCARAPRR